MRAFIILCCFVAAATAGLLPGYNYGPGLTSSGSELISSGLSHIGGGVVSTGSGLGLGGGLISSGSGLGLSNIGGGVISSGSGLGLSNIGGSVISSGSGLGLSNIGGGVITSGGLGLGGGLVSGGTNIVGGGLSGGTTVLGLDALNAVPQQVELSKQFFHFTAPDEIVDQGQTTQQLSNVLKKNLQVVFIKAPENNAATNAALQIAKQAIEQKTSIYVLSKENDAAQVVGQLQQIQENVPTTPEVRFIKYRTPEDIAHAKHSIQSQYDSFGGYSENIDGGVAPVLNYASNVHAGHLLGTGLGSSVSYGSGVGLGNAYGGRSLISTISAPNYLPSSPFKK